MSPSDLRSGLEIVAGELRALADRIDVLSKDPTLPGVSDAAFASDLCTGSLEQLRDAMRENAGRS